MITCVIQYTIDPNAPGNFEKYAAAWPPVIERCGGKLTGYYLPKEGANDFALALIDFDSLAAYEQYRERLAADPDARANIEFARTTRCIQAERRSFLRKAA
jgi:NIPSNAP protein